MNNIRHIGLPEMKRKAFHAGLPEMKRKAIHAGLPRRFGGEGSRTRFFSRVLGIRMTKGVLIQNTKYKILITFLYTPLNSFRFQRRSFGNALKTVFATFLHSKRRHLCHSGQVLSGFSVILNAVKDLVSRFFVSLRMTKGVLIPNTKYQILNTKRLRRWRAIAILFLIAGASLLFRAATPAKAVDWWTGGGGSWQARKQLTVTNNSAATLSANTTVAITIDTKTLVNSGKLRSDCADLRIVYQPNSSTATDLTRYLSYPSASPSCATSTATKVYFPLQASLASASSAQSYYAYYKNSSATAPASTDNAFDIGAIDATLVCPFDGSSTCAAGETPSTATGAIRYSGSKSALSFDGSNDFALGTGIGVNGGSAITVETWFKTPVAQSNKYFVAIPYTSASNNGVDLNTLSAGALSANVKTSIGVVTPQFAVTYNDNTWHHFAVTYDGSNVRIFYDGELKSTTPHTGTISTQSDGEYNVGRFGTWGGQYTGLIDEVRISNTARYTSNFTPTTSPFIRDSNTKLLLHFDESGDDPRNTGKAIDDSGNGNHGTITGAKYVAGLVGVDGTAGSDPASQGQTLSQSYASHQGIFIEEGTTNKITNPSFENATAYDTNWSSNGLSTWWTAGGASGAVAAYAPTTATDLADSYVNDANPGTYNAAPGVAPTWASGTGWTFNGSTQYLTSGFTPAAGGSMIARVSGFTGGLAGEAGTGAGSLYLFNHSSTGLIFANGGLRNDSIVSTFSGVMAVAGQQGYLNGASYLAAISAWTGTPIEMQIGAVSAYAKGTGALQAIAIYSGTLTAPQVQAVTASMNTLGLTVTENTTAPYYKFGSKSAKIVASGDGNFTTSLNPGITCTGWNQGACVTNAFSAYVYNGTAGAVGGTVDATVASLIWMGTAQTTTYTDMGGGWWRLVYAGTATDATNSFGIRILSGKTVYVDGFQMEIKTSDMWGGRNYATSYADGSLGTGYAWSGTAHNSTSTRTAEALRYTATGNIDGSAGSVSLWAYPLYNHGTQDMGWNKTDMLFSTSDTDSNADGEAVQIYRTTADTYYCRVRGASVSLGSLANNKWHHITVSWDGTNVGCFLNGATRGTTPYSGVIQLSRIVIAANNTWNVWTKSSAVISDLRIFNDDLTTTQAADIYNSGLIAHSEGYQVDAFDEEKGQDPVAIYHMDEGYGSYLRDSSPPVQNDITLGVGSSAPSWDVQGGLPSGGVGQPSLRFDGSNDYASRAYDSDFNFGSDPFSISGWFRHPSSVTDTDTILSMYSGSTGYKVYMNSSGFICFLVGSYSSCTLQSFATSDWHHFEAIKGSDSLKLYIDGVEKASTTIPTSYQLSAVSSLFLGMDNAGTSFWNGYLDEFYIYPYARSADQVKVDYNMRSSVILSDSVSSSGSTGGSSLSNGLVGYWKMDEASGDRYDSSGNNNTLTDYNTVASGAGKFGNGGDFEANDLEYLSITDNPSLSMGDIDFTVSCWLKLESLPVVASTPLAKGGVSAYSDEEYALYITSAGNISMVVGTGTTEGLATWSAPLTTGIWYHIVGYHDATNNLLGITVNNSVPVTAAWSTGVRDHTSAFALGRSTSGGAWSYDGLIDEARVYKRLLSPSEIRTLYEFAPGPVAHWKFDEGSGGTVADVSGNSSTGTWAGTGSHWIPGKYGNAGQFNGSSDYVDVGNVSTLGFEKTNSFSGSLWIKHAQTSDANIVSKQQNSGLYTGWGLGIGHSKLEFFMYSNGGVVIDFPSAYADNSWHHIGFTYNGNSAASGVSIYVDGVSVSKSVLSDTVVSTIVSTASFQLNARGGANNLFAGSLDDVRIYNYPRTQAQIVQDMRAGEPAPGADDNTPSSMGSRPAAPVAWYKFDEGADNTCTGGVNDACNQGSGGTALDGAQSGMSVPATATSGWTNSGKYSKAMVFDGSGDFVSVADNSALKSDYITVSAWVKLATPLASQPELFPMIINKYMYNDSGYGLYFDLNANVLQWRTYKAVSTQNDLNVTGASALFGTDWHHVMATWDGTTKNIYVDGIKKATVAYSGTLYHLTNPQNLMIGAYPGGSVNELRGSIDEVKIYNFALTQDQVKLEYNASSALSFGGQGKGAEDSGYATERWWEAGGAKGAVAAYQPIGASSLATSYKNLVNPGVYDAAPGVAPTFASGTGWTFNGSSTILTTGIIPTSEYSMIARFSGVSGGAQRSIAGSKVSTGATKQFFIWPNDGGGIRRYGMGNSEIMNSGTVSSGVMAIAGLTGYRNGVSDATGTGSFTTGGLEIYIGAYNYNDGTHYAHTDGSIQAIAIYNTTLTADQVRSVTNAMNRLGSNDTPSLAPVAEWKLDENNGQYAKDTSGNNNTGTLGTGATPDGSDPSWTSTGKVGAALKFDGVDDYVKVTDVDAIDFAYNQSFTVSFWAKTSGCDNDSMVEKWSESGGYPYALRCSSGVVLFSRYDATNVPYVLGSTLVNNNSWHYVTGVKNGSNMHLYIDGVQDGNSVTDTTSGTTTNTSDLYFGRRGATTAYNFTGLIDQVKIYNYARTPAQIAYDYNGGAPVAWYKMDECFGGTINSTNVPDNSALDGTWYGTGGGTQTAVGTCGTVGTAWGNGADGKYSASLNFDGSDDYVRVPYSSNLDFKGASKSFTLSSWVKINSVDGGDAGILGRYLGPVTENYQYGLKFETDTNDIKFAVQDGTFQIAESAANSISAGNWYHVVGVANAGTLTIYINGVASGTTDTYGTIGDIGTEEQIEIGVSNRELTPEYFPGLIDDVRIYNYALSSDQIKTLYNENASVQFGD